ncbi:MAG TPA: hypothetical protein VNZ53_07195 [Steroidobacteraceae bacterium]|jgi:hypothetical protein|nr:hypothetical protein [Steroidobacteraceae bacterium]
MSKLVATLLLSLSGLAVTGAYFAPPSFWGSGGGGGGGGDSRHHIAAPEIDPSSAVSALTLLLGGLVVLRGRFRKQ